MKNTKTSLSDYKGFGEHLLEFKKLDLPTDRQFLAKLAKKYNCPIPGTIFWNNEFNQNSNA